MNATDVKSHKNYKKVSSEPLQEFMDMQNYTPKMMADALGQSGGNVIATWLKNKQMPAMAGIALEGLKRRMGKGDTRHYLLILSGEKAGTALTVIKSLGGTVKEIEL